MNESGPKAAPKIPPAGTIVLHGSSIPPIPRGVVGRLEWFQALDDAFAQDVLASFAEMRSGDWTVRGAHGALTDGFATYVCSRITEAIGMAADVAVLQDAGVR
jgi:hypothetical protein